MILAHLGIFKFPGVIGSATQPYKKRDAREKILRSRYFVVYISVIILKHFNCYIIMNFLPNFDMLFSFFEKKFPKLSVF